jgi:hypothetical protein
MSIDSVSLVAGLLACAIVGWLLWLAFGRFPAVATKIAAAIGATVLGFILYFGGQAILEVISPAARAANGDVIARGHCSSPRSGLLRDRHWRVTRVARQFVFPQQSRQPRS